MMEENISQEEYYNSKNLIIFNSFILKFKKNFLKQRFFMSLLKKSIFYINFYKN
jgi:hypothetical protein